MVVAYDLKVWNPILLFDVGYFVKISKIVNTSLDEMKI